MAIGPLLREEVWDEFLLLNTYFIGLVQFLVKAP